MSPLTLAQALAREAGLRVELVTTFDYPDSQVIFTQPTAINEAGDIVGYAVTNDLVYFGFVRYADGSFSDPIVEPSDGDNFTVATGITDDGMICGYFRDGATREHGYFLSNGTFTQVTMSRVPRKLCFLGSMMLETSSGMPMALLYFRLSPSAELFGPFAFETRVILTMFFRAELTTSVNFQVTISLRVFCLPTASLARPTRK